MHDDAINDIATALMHLRDTFKKYNIPVPDELSYSDPKDARDGKRALYSIPASSSLMDFRISQTSDDMDMEIVGFKILWT